MVDSVLMNQLLVIEAVYDAPCLTKNKYNDLNSSFSLSTCDRTLSPFSFSSSMTTLTRHQLEIGNPRNQKNEKRAKPKDGSRRRLRIGQTRTKNQLTRPIHSDFNDFWREKRPGESFGINRLGKLRFRIQNKASMRLSLLN
jgi:hypothetical protein